MPGLDPGWFPLPIDGAVRSLDPGAVATGSLEACLSRDGDAPGESFVYLDCGSWAGDGKSQALERSFGLVCGATAVLCSFAGHRPMAMLPEDPAGESGPLNKLLATLAGPMKIDVTVERVARAGGAVRASPDRTVYVLLPGPDLPLVMPMPELDPNLVPDPTRANCACHGPVISRMLYGTPDAPAMYRATSALLSRNPSDWFYLLAESYKPAANDLAKLLERLSRHSPTAPVHLIQLGGLCDVWPGYKCVFQGSGRAAFVEPEILEDVPEEELASRWLPVAMATKNREAVARLLRYPAGRRTLLRDGAFESPGGLWAEGRSAVSFGDDEPPLAFLALREQKAQFRPWRRALPPGFRIAELSRAAARWKERPFSVFATARGGSPSLLSISMGPGRAIDALAEPVSAGAP